MCDTGISCTIRLSARRSVRATQGRYAASLTETTRRGTRTARRKGDA